MQSTTNLTRTLLALVIIFVAGFATRVAAQQQLLFPGRGANLGTSHYWVVNEFSEGPNILDLKIRRWDADLDRWTSRKDGITQAKYDADPTNDKHLTYGVPLYAPVSGEIISCWRNAPDNPQPDVKLPEVTGENGARRISAAGNHVSIRTAEGNVVFIAHLQPDTLPPGLCPNAMALMNDANDRTGSFPTEAVIPAGSRPQVQQNDFIGLAGNSGNSEGPHFHISFAPLNGFTKGNDMAMPFYGAWAQNHDSLVNVNPAAWSKLAPGAITSAAGNSLILPSPFLRRDDATGGAVSEVAAPTWVANVGAVTAVRDGAGDLKLNTWGVNSSGVITPDSEEVAGAATQVAVEHPGLTRDVVTAMRDSNGDLKLIAWDILQSGGIVRKGDELAGAVTKVAMTRVPTGGIGVITAVRLGTGELKLIAWEVTTDKQFIRRGEATAGAVTEVAVTRVVEGFTGVVTATRGANGNLKLISWDVTPSLQIIKKAEAEAGAVTAVTTATVRVANFKEMVVTAVRLTDGNLKLIAWEVDANGQLTRRGEVLGGAISKLALTHPQDNDLVTTVRDGASNLKLIAWEVSATGEIQRQGDTWDGAVTQVAISDKLTVGGKPFLVGAFRLNDGNLKTITWELNLNQ